MKHHKTILLSTAIMLVLLCGGAFTYAQSTSWIWAKPLGDRREGRSYGLAIDAAQNLYQAGYFTSEEVDIGKTALKNVGADDIYIAKYDSDGNVLWATSVGGSLSERATCVATDGKGNIYVTGLYNSPALVFGSTALNPVPGNFGPTDMFLAKYDSSGNALWAKSIGGSGEDAGLSVMADKGGNVYVTGYFKSVSITCGTATLSNSGNADMFIAKYDSSGNTLWAESLGGTEDEYGSGITTDDNGHIYVTGFYKSPVITSDGITLNNVDTTGTADAFLLNYSTSGKLIWGKSIGGNQGDYGNRVTTDISGNVYLTGYYTSASVPIGSTVLTCSGLSDAFIVRYDALGNVLWAQSIGDSLAEYGMGITTDLSGNIYLSGNFTSPVITIGATKFISTGYTDVFIVKFDPRGSVLWATSVGGITGDGTRGVVVDMYDNIYLIGYFSTPGITFGSFTLTQTVGSDGFIAKLKPEKASFGSACDDPSIHIVPNPTSSMLLVSVPVDKWSIVIYTMLGASVYQSELAGSQLRINLAGQPKGIYFYRLKNELGVVKTGTIILE